MCDSTTNYKIEVDGECPDCGCRDLRDEGLIIVCYKCGREKLKPTSNSTIGD